MDLVGDVGQFTHGVLEEVAQVRGHPVDDMLAGGQEGGDLAQTDRERKRCC